MGFSLNPLNDLSSVLHTGEKIMGDGAKDFKDVMKDAGKAVTHISPSDIGHTVLNVAGMIPVIGAPADAINAGWYAAQGDWGNAALSAATAIPGVGDLVGGARLGATGLKIVEDGAKIAEDGVKAKRAEQIAEAAESASPKFVKDFATKDTVNYSARYGSEREARSVARTKLGRDPVQAEPGKLRSQDGRWQYRAKPSDLAGHGANDSPHIHLERLDPTTGKVLENWHLRW